MNKQASPRRVAQRYAAATTPKDVHALADELDISWDNDPGFMSWTKKVVGKEHLDDMSEKELRDVMSVMKSDPPKKTAIDLGVVDLKHAVKVLTKDRHLDAYPRGGGGYEITNMDRLRDVDFDMTPTVSMKRSIEKSLRQASKKLCTQ